jgi:hypothetical protein
MSRRAVSDEHFAILTHFDVVSLPSNPSSQADIEARLIRVVGLSENLLGSRDEVLAEAYDLQVKQVAYVERAGTGARDEVI